MRKVLVPEEFSDTPDQWHLAPIVDTGELVFLSGITGVHPDGSLSGDPETQFRDAFRFVAMHLETAGLQFDNIVEMTTYHAWSAIGITELITEGTLAEIRIIAKRQ